MHSQEEADLIYLPFYAAMECRLSQAMEGDAHKKAYHARVSETRFVPPPSFAKELRWKEGNVQ